MNKEVLTTGDVARLCHVTIRTVIKWFEAGLLPGFKIPASRDRRFSRTDVLAFMQKHAIPLIESDGGGRRRVLIVDDEPAIVLLIETFLRQLALFDFQSASNGYEAGLKTRSFRPHLLLTDYNLGDTTGVELAKSARADPELGRMKIVVVSGFLGEAEAADLPRHGIDGFLRKPFTFEQLRDMLLGQLGLAAS